MGEKHVTNNRLPMANRPDFAGVPSELVKRQSWETGRMYKVKLVVVITELVMAKLLDSGKWRRREGWLERR